MFKSIKNYEGFYEINELGVVQSISRTIINKHGKEQFYPGRVLKADEGKFGHKRVTLCKDHKTTRKLIHQLVAQTFIDNPENKPFINHIDNDPRNNHVTNIEWCTHSENMVHAQKQGRLFDSQSKGGRTGGISTKRAIAAYKAMVGTTFGCWDILSIADKRGSKQYFNVRCNSCGSEYTREKSYITTSKQTQCIHCKTR